MDEIDRLRFARRGKQLTFIYRKTGSDQDRILAQVDIDDGPIPMGNVRLQLHTGGAERTSEVLLKHLRIRAEKIDPVAPDTPTILEELAKQLTGELPSSALEFDGKSQYVTIPSIRYDGSHPITLEAYATLDDFGNVIIGDTQRSGVGLGIWGKDYTMHAWNGRDFDVAGRTIAATRFLRVHLAGTFDGQTLKVFVNGKHRQTTELNGKFSGSGYPMTIGASPSPREIGIDFAFAGVIDGVRVSKTIRYTEDFAVPTMFEADENTLALYRFDKGRGQTLADSSGNKHHGEIRGAKWVTGAAIRQRAALGLKQQRADTKFFFDVPQLLDDGVRAPNHQVVVVLQVLIGHFVHGPLPAGCIGGAAGPGEITRRRPVFSWAF